ncbi:GNAT family N-acetyltransferase [Nitriliruptoraceae bacterium ZYF776]|nr:GNAT family N-acetyltransferase [Profundirhabdus halotolerans]
MPGRCMAVVAIEAATVTDFRRTSELHHRYLAAGIFPRMGVRFLRCYHETFAASPYGKALVARHDGELVGFLLGTVDNAAHYRWVVKERGMALARSGATALLCRPHVAWSFATTRLDRYLRGLQRHLSQPATACGPAPPGGDDGASSPLAILTHIVTTDAVRGRGVGRQLVEAFLAQARARGAEEARLITASGGPAAAFYAGLGWAAVADRCARDGSRVREYRMVLSEVEGA